MSTNPKMAIGLAVLMATVALSPTVAARTETESYTTGADALTSCREEIVGGLIDRNAGSACFDVNAGESTVSAEIDDFATEPVGGAVQFFDDNGDQAGQLTPFCGSASGVPIPSGAAEVKVLVDGPILHLIDCGGAGTSTTGTVTVTFA